MQELFWDGKTPYYQPDITALQIHCQSGRSACPELREAAFFSAIVIRSVEFLRVELSSLPYDDRSGPARLTLRFTGVSQHYCPTY